MMIDERIVTKAILETYTARLIASLEVDCVICGAGPSGLVAGYFLAKNGARVAIFEKTLSVGGGMWGGGMMFNQIVVQEEARSILDEFGITAVPYGEGYFVAQAIECVSGLCFGAAKAGVSIFNLISVEDLVVRDGSVRGVVINWTAVEMASLHVDPLTVSSRFVVDCTGHATEIVGILQKKMDARLFTPSGRIEGERSLWADAAEKATLENTREVYPGLFVAGMSANATFGSFRMGPVFGGMLLSGKKVAELILERMR
jgi:thiamine thiazole synthase